MKRLLLIVAFATGCVESKRVLPVCFNPSITKGSVNKKYLFNEP
ncbi:MAG: hypothetical protein P8X60_08625 [Robiginitalea sp.]|jgi:hypothetical protein